MLISLASVAWWGEGAEIEYRINHSSCALVRDIERKAIEPLTACHIQGDDAHTETALEFPYRMNYILKTL